MQTPKAAGAKPEGRLLFIYVMSFEMKINLILVNDVNPKHIVIQKGILNCDKEFEVIDTETWEENTIKDFSEYIVNDFEQIINLLTVWQYFDFIKVNQFGTTKITYKFLK